MPTAPDPSPPPLDEPARPTASTFDYDAIPEGYYDRVMREERRTAVLITPARVYANPG